MNMIEKLIFFTPSAILLIWAWHRFWLPKIIEMFHESIKKAVDDIKKKQNKINQIEKDSGSEKYIKYRSSKLGYITKIVGWTENLFFGILLIFILTNTGSNLERVDLFFKIFGGWLVIKTVVSYDQWSHKIAGKAYFYVSLIGTFLNIIFSTIMGLSFYYIFY